VSDNQSLDTAVPELGKSFDCYFSDKDFQQYPAWMRKPFSFDITTANVKDP